MDITKIHYIQNLISFLKNIKLYKSVINVINNKENNNYLSFNNKLINIKLQVIIDILNNNITISTIEFYKYIYSNNVVELNILIYIIFLIMYVNNDIIINNNNILLNSTKINNISTYNIQQYLSNIDINIENIEYKSLFIINFDIKNLFILEYFFINNLNLIIDLNSKNRIKSSILYYKIVDNNNLDIFCNYLNADMIIHCDEIFNYNKILNI